MSPTFKSYPSVCSPDVSTPLGDSLRVRPKALKLSAWRGPHKCPFSLGPLSMGPPVPPVSRSHHRVWYFNSWLWLVTTSSRRNNRGSPTNLSNIISACNLPWTLRYPSASTCSAPWNNNLPHHTGLFKCRCSCARHRRLESIPLGPAARLIPTVLFVRRIGSINHSSSFFSAAVASSPPPVCLSSTFRPCSCGIPGPYLSYLQEVTCILAPSRSSSRPFVLEKQPASDAGPFQKPSEPIHAASPRRFGSLTSHPCALFEIRFSPPDPTPSASNPP